MVQIIGSRGRGIQGCRVQCRRNIGVEEVLLGLGGYMAGVSKGWSERKESLEVCSSIKCNMMESLSAVQGNAGTLLC